MEDDHVYVPAMGWVWVSLGLGIFYILNSVPQDVCYDHSLKKSNGAYSDISTGVTFRYELSSGWCFIYAP